jgi:hypothetical protein
MKEDEMGRTCSTYETRNAYSILIEKPERKRPLGRARLRWKINIRMDLRETEWESRGLDSSGLG